MPLARVKQRLRHPDPNSYVGKGKLEQIVEMRDELRATVAILDDELTPAQQRTLEQRLGIKVIDRTALILDIFAQRARTREGVVQVALAQHEYLLPRLTGQWEHLERMEGAIGSRGPGETQLETDRRLIRNQIKRLKKDLERVRTHRQQHRNKRDRAGIPLVALVGYTNAGKSTLMNALTNANVRARDRLFETLDPTTRRCRLSEQHTVLLSDTVGFIQKLPTQLVAAFRATLEELEEADLLLHVVDGTAPDVLEQVESVERTLRDLGVDQRPTLTVVNKIDVLERAAGRRAGCSRRTARRTTDRRVRTGESQPRRTARGDRADHPRVGGRPYHPSSERSRRRRKLIPSGEPLPLRLPPPSASLSPRERVGVRALRHRHLRHTPVTTSNVCANIVEDANQ